MKLRSVCSLALVLVLAVPASATTWVVGPGGEIQFWISMPFVVDGDIIELTDGTFAGDGNRDIDYLGKAITIRSQSGNPATCVIDCEGSVSDPHRGFIFQSGEGPESVLEGVTITNGYAPQDPGYGIGGGVLCLNASPTFRNCLFSDNPDSGMYSEGGSPLLDNCTFSGNSGGGMVFGGSPILDNCAFSGNSNGSGGGISGRGAALITDCTFTANTAGQGGGIYLDGSSAVLTRCLFSLNAAQRGGGMYYQDSSSGVLTDCVFSGNTADQAGGGLFCDEIDPTILITRCTFYGNVAESGGGLACGFFMSYPTVSNCTFTGNSASSGAGIHSSCSDCSPTVENTIIAFSPQGEGVSCVQGGSATLTCCDVYGNAGGDWTDCIEDQFGINGNVEADPLFCDAASEDFSLHADSPCAPGNSGGCGLVGAWPVGCATTAVEPTTWGAIKNQYR